MKSCSGSQWLARKIKEQGHQVQLIAPQHVKAYVAGNKNDFIDAEAICEAASRPSPRSVQVKTVEQQVLCTEHRLRKSLVSRRTAVINQVHGFLLASGVIFPAGYAALDRVSGLMQSRLAALEKNAANLRAWHPRGLVAPNSALTAKVPSRCFSRWCQRLYPIVCLKRCRNNFAVTATLHAPFEI
jgi:transposase